MKNIVHPAGPPGNFQYILKKVDVPILPPDVCEQRLRQTRLGPFFELSRTSFICAGAELGKDACTVKRNLFSRLNFIEETYLRATFY